MRFTLQRKARVPTAILLGILAAGLILYGLWFMEMHLKPALMTMAETRAMQLATQTVNDVVREKVMNGVDAESLVNIKQDQQGRIVFIQPDTMAMNQLTSDTTLKVQASLRKLSEEKIKIPIGQAFGNPFFARIGPEVSVTIIPAGTVQSKIVDKFEQAGINQTRHMIYLVATTKIKIVIPFVSKDVGVDTQVLLTEYVVVGEVPSTYVQIPLSEAGGER